MFRRARRRVLRRRELRRTLRFEVRRLFRFVERRFVDRRFDFAREVRREVRRLLRRLVAFFFFLAARFFGATNERARTKPPVQLNARRIRYPFPRVRRFHAISSSPALAFEVPSFLTFF